MRRVTRRSRLGQGEGLDGLASTCPPRHPANWPKSSLCIAF